MKTIYLKIFLALFIIVSACAVDDFTDANPPRQKDAPAGFVTTLRGDAITDTETDGTTYTFVKVNVGTAVFDIEVVDAPGLIDSISAISSKELGELDGDLLAAKGKKTGSIQVTYTAGDVFSTGASNAGNENITISVFDAQSPRKSFPLAAPHTIKTVNATCFASRPLVGFYDTVTSGFDSETLASYTNLEAVVEFRINAGGVNHPGFYRLTDGSFGLYPLQGFAGNFINITVCDNSITNANEEFTNLFTGTLNADGTISITWSNTFGDTGTTVMTPQ